MPVSSYYGAGRCADEVSETLNKDNDSDYQLSQARWGCMRLNLFPSGEQNRGIHDTIKNALKKIASIDPAIPSPPHIGIKRTSFRTDGDEDQPQQNERRDVSGISTSAETVHQHDGDPHK
jgi:hypothetical protein